MTDHPALPIARSLIREHEGCERRDPATGLIHPYRDPVGLWTIGWGQRCDADQTPLTQAEADARLDTAILGLIAELVRISPRLEPHPPRMAAIVSFAYNLGLGKYKGSTMRKYIDRGLWAMAADEMKKWVYAGQPPRVLPGLVRRREAEAKKIK